MTIESLPGSVTAPDPLEVENDALRAEVAAERKEREVWASRARDYCKSWDDSRAAAERLQTVAFQAQNAAIDLAQQVATLTAERDAARAEVLAADEANAQMKVAIEKLWAKASLYLHHTALSKLEGQTKADHERDLAAVVNAATAAIRARGGR